MALILHIYKLSLIILLSVLILIITLARTQDSSMKQVQESISAATIINISPKIRLVAQHLILIDDEDLRKESKRMFKKPIERKKNNLILLKRANRNYEDYNHNKHRQESILEIISEESNATIILDEIIYSDSVLHLECVAPYPITWIYKGDGYLDPILTTLNSKRTFQNFYNSSTYTFSTKLDLISLTEKNTGKYICRDTNEGGGKPESYFNIYVPGENIFITNSLSLKAQHISTKESDFESINILLPCSLSNPNINMQLYKIDQKTSYLQKQLISDTLYFEPSQGFMMKLNSSSNTASLNNVWGNYICMTEDRKRFLKIIVEPPKDWIIQISPNTKYISQSLYATQYLECASKLPVKLVIKYDGKEKLVPNYQEIYNKNYSTYPYIASLNIYKSPFSDVITIDCVNSQNGKILHTWEYSDLGQGDISSFGYDKNTNSFLCCTNSTHVPILKHIPCTNKMECQIRKYFYTDSKYKVQKQEYKRKRLGQIGSNNNFCATSLFNETLDNETFIINGGGMFQCLIGESSDDDYYYTWRFEDGNENNPIVNLFEDQAETERIEIKLKNSFTSKNQINEIKLGDEIEVDCLYNTFYYSNDHAWAFGLENGTISLVNSDLIHKKLFPIVDNDDTNQEKIKLTEITTIKFLDTNIIKLICLVPVWNSSHEWKNISLPIFIQ